MKISEEFDKGQLNSSKIERKQFVLRYHTSEVECFRPFFGRIEDTYQKDISKLTDLYLFAKSYVSYCRFSKLYPYKIGTKCNGS